MSAGLAEVLAKHQLQPAGIWRASKCRCGWRTKRPAKTDPLMIQQHRAHLAAAVTEWLGERLREARTDVRVAINDNPDEWEMDAPADAALAVVAGGAGDRGGAPWVNSSRSRTRSSTRSAARWRSTTG